MGKGLPPGGPFLFFLDNQLISSTIVDMSKSSKVISFRVSDSMHQWLLDEATARGYRSANDLARALFLERTYTISSTHNLDTESPSALYGVANAMVSKELGDLNETVKRLAARINERHFDDGKE